MINQNNPSEQTNIAFLKALKALKLAGLLRDSGIRKAQGIKVATVFELLLLLAFQGKNLYQYLDSKYQETAASKMIKNALKQGIEADYVLMDTWFTHSGINEKHPEICGTIQPYGTSI